MEQEKASVDQLYLAAETLAQDFSLFPRKETAAVIKGLLTEQQIEIEVERLRGMDVDAYIAAAVSPAEEGTRAGAKEIIQALDVPILSEMQDGPFYTAELDCTGELKADELQWYQASSWLNRAGSSICLRCLGPRASHPCCRCCR